LAASTIETVYTPRLVLTRPTERDLPDLVRMHRDPRVMATLGGLRSDAELTTFHEQLLAHWASYGFGWWAARMQADGSFVGRGGLRSVTLGGVGEIEVGYGLVPEFWGRGLATELAAVAVRTGFHALHLKALVCFALPDNRASRRVMEKVGFRYERDIVHGGLLHALYRLTAGQWRAICHTGDVHWNAPPGA
jgi:RimJ/RimL family protein N-acetyltransferase